MPFDHTTNVELYNDTDDRIVGSVGIDHIPRVVQSQAITRLAAKALFKQISTDKETLINFSLKYGILCPHTTFIGVEKRLNNTSDSNANMELREVPIMIHSSSSHRTRSLLTTLDDTRNTIDGLDDLIARSASLSLDAKCFYRTARTTRTFSHSISSIVNAISSLFSQREGSITTIPTIGYDQALNVNIWPTDEQKLVDRFIELQQFDGLWMLTSDDVKQLTGKSLSNFSSSVTKGIEEKYQELTITTAIVIIILQNRCSSKKILWQTLVTKANKRLEELLNGDENKLKQLIKDCENF